MDSTQTDTQRLAAEAYGWFETATCGDSGQDEDRYTRCKDGAPEWVQELVREAHGDMFPDDWRYSTIRSALECLSEADDPDDAAHEWADAEVDVYTGARLAWLASHLSRPGYCDEARDDIYGETVPTSIGVIELVGLGQYQEAREVFSLVLRAIEAQ